MLKPELICRKICVKKSPIHGYGVFADQDFEEGEVIEECYTITVSEDDRSISNYYFNHRKNNNKVVLPFGYGAIYNHSTEPNALFAVDTQYSLITYKAKRFIKKGEEIFINYGSYWFSSRQLVMTSTLKYAVLKFARLVLRFSLVFAAIYAFILFTHSGMR